MDKITPFLWFDSQAEEAANLYVSLFPNSRITRVIRYGPAGPGPEGQVMLVEFELDGRTFTGLNGGAHVSFSEAVSFSIDCETQAEVDRLWDALLANGGEPIQCGWLKDRFGLRWQVVPQGLVDLINDPDRDKSRRAMEAMMNMVKLDIDELRRAHAGFAEA